MIGDNVKKIRLAVGLSQRDFAEKLGVSSGVVTNLEYNKLTSPEKKMPLLRLIAEKFNVPLDWILSDEPGDPPLQEKNELNPYAQATGEMVEADPVVKSFLEFWAQRTVKEREQIAKAIDDFYAILQKNRQE